MCIWQQIHPSSDWGSLVAQCLLKAALPSIDILDVELQSTQMFSSFIPTFKINLLFRIPNTSHRSYNDQPLCYFTEVNEIGLFITTYCLLPTDGDILKETIVNNFRTCRIMQIIDVIIVRMTRHIVIKRNALLRNVAQLKLAYYVQVSVSSCVLNNCLRVY